MHMTDMGIFDKEALLPFILKAVFKHTTDMSIFLAPISHCSLPSTYRLLRFTKSSNCLKNLVKLFYSNEKMLSKQALS